MRSLLPLSLALAVAGAACSDPDPGVNNPPSGGTAGVGVAGSAAGSAAAGGGAGGASAGTAGSGGVSGSSAGGGAGGTGGVDNPMPTMLSQTGLYSDIAAKTLAPGVVPFEPTYALWSDGAGKKRWVYMPPGGKIQTDANGRGMEYWVYPKGFKLWKEFSRDGKVIETRLLQKLSDFATDWYMVAFKWNDTYTDATAVPNGEMNAMATQHDIPSQKQCSDCHEAMVDNALGFTALQLSHDDATGGMTLAKAVELGWFNTPPPATGYKLPGTEVEQKALGYLHANCGMCHNSFGTVYTAKTNLNLWTELDKLAGSVQKTAAYLSLACDQWPSVKTLSPVFPSECEAGHATGTLMDTDLSKQKRIVPKDPANSSVHHLMTMRTAAADSTQMPPLGTEMADTAGLADVDAWINSLPLQ